MLVTTRHWLAFANGDDKITVRMKRSQTLTEELLAELEMMRKRCFPEYNLRIDVKTGGTDYAFVKC